MSEDAKNSRAEVLNKMHFEVRYAEAAAENKKKVDALIGELKSKITTGDYVAFQHLYALAFESTVALHELATEHLPAIQQFVRRKTCWPVLASPGKSVFEQFELFLDEIDLGKDWPIDLRRLMKTDTVSRRWIFNLIRRIEVVRLEGKAVELIENAGLETPNSGVFTVKIRNLPPLTRATVDEWFEVCWQILLENTGGKPESNPELFQLGDDAKAKDAKTPDGIVRDNIKRRFRQTLASLLVA